MSSGRNAVAEAVTMCAELPRLPQLADRAFRLDNEDTTVISALWRDVVANPAVTFCAETTSDASRMGSDPAGYKHAQQSSISLSAFYLPFFPGEPGLAGFIRAQDDGSGETTGAFKTCKAPVKSSPSTNQHPTFCRPDAFSVVQPTACKQSRET